MEGVGGAGEGADADAFVDWGDAEFGWGVRGDQEWGECDCWGGRGDFGWGLFFTDERRGGEDFERRGEGGRDAGIFSGI